MAYNKRFKLVQFERATIDLDNAVTYYNSRQEGLGKRFYLEYKKTLKTIKRNPHYRTFYDDVHCLQVGKFPYLIHYIIDTQHNQVSIEALICAYQNPGDAYLKK